MPVETYPHLRWQLSWHSDSCRQLCMQHLTACKCTDCYFCKEMFIEILRGSADTLVKRLACLCAYGSNGVADRHLWLSTFMKKEQAVESIMQAIALHVSLLCTSLPQSVAWPM